MKYMAVNQYGNTYHGLTHPRKDLLARLGRSHADKMYVDKTDGSVSHTGYIIGDEWLSIYKVEPWKSNG